PASFPARRWRQGKLRGGASPPLDPAANLSAGMATHLGRENSFRSFSPLLRQLCLQPGLIETVAHASSITPLANTSSTSKTLSLSTQRAGTKRVSDTHRLPAFLARLGSARDCRPYL